jgi:shikimate kinase
MLRWGAVPCIPVAMHKRVTARTIDDIRARLEDRSIVIIGLMGAGKSTIGRRLAERLGIAFTDADAEIEKAAGKSIAEIFAEHGEPYFRDGERKVIARLLRSGPQVLATGGGAFMSEETRKAIKEQAVSVWLKADLALLMKRVRRRSHRPLLQAEDPDAVMAELMEKRYPVYALADITVESRDVPHNIIVNDVVRALMRYWSGPAVTREDDDEHDGVRL